MGRPSFPPLCKGRSGGVDPTTVEHERRRSSVSLSLPTFPSSEMRLLTKGRKKVGRTRTLGVTWLPDLTAL